MSSKFLSNHVFRFRVSVGVLCIKELGITCYCDSSLLSVTLMFHNVTVPIVTGLCMLICLFVSIASVRLLRCCFLEITMAVIADVQLTNGCCLRDCGVEHFKLSWQNRVLALQVARQCTHELISLGTVQQHQDWQ